MDEKRPAYDLKALSRSGPSLRLPGRDPFPGVDDHLVVPEITRDEIVRGRRVVAMPAQPPHADRQSSLDHLLQTHVSPGYVASADLLTRHAIDSDFASDACVYREGVDPETGTRYLEEMAFEVVSEQKKRLATEKAALMQRRGVRRIFAIFLKGQRVCEWSADSQTWYPLDRDAQIEDSCLVTPLPVAALLDKTAASIAAVRGMAAQGNSEIQRREVVVRVEARAEAKAEDVLKILEVRGLAVNEAQRQEILGCRDLDLLDRWLNRAVLASSAEEACQIPEK